MGSEKVRENPSESGEKIQAKSEAAKFWRESEQEGEETKNLNPPANEIIQYYPRAFIYNPFKPVRLRKEYIPTIHKTLFYYFIRKVIIQIFDVFQVFFKLI